MRHPRAFLLLLGLALWAWPGSASAQTSIWLQKGVSGFGASASLAYNEDQTTYGFTGGYSLRGFIDFELSIAVLDFPDEPLPEDLVGVAFTPRVEWHPLKQGPGMPISVGIGSGLTFFNFASDELERNDTELRALNFSADATVYRFFKLSSNFGITPAAGIGYVHSETWLTQFGEEEESVSDDNFGGAGGVYIAFLDRTGRIWGVAPSMAFTDEVVTVAIRAGIVWTL